MANSGFSARAKTLVLILELWERVFAEIAAHGETDAWEFDEKNLKSSAKMYDVFDSKS